MIENFLLSIESGGGRDWRSLNFSELSYVQSPKFDIEALLAEDEEV